MEFSKRSGSSADPAADFSWSIKKNSFSREVAVAHHPFSTDSAFQGQKQIALEVSTDDEHRFELAIQVRPHSRSCQEKFHSH